MVIQDDDYPNFPKLQCQTCEERFEIPRKWGTTEHQGNQIFIDWVAGEAMMKFHAQIHFDTLIQETEEYLRASAK